MSWPPDRRKESEDSHTTRLGRRERAQRVVDARSMHTRRWWRCCWPVTTRQMMAVDVRVCDVHGGLEMCALGENSWWYDWQEHFQSRISNGALDHSHRDVHNKAREQHRDSDIESESSWQEHLQSIAWPLSSKFTKGEESGCYPRVPECVVDVSTGHSDGFGPSRTWPCTASRQ